MTEQTAVATANAPTLTKKAAAAEEKVAKHRQLVAAEKLLVKGNAAMNSAEGTLADKRHYVGGLFWLVSKGKLYKTAEGIDKPSFKSWFEAQDYGYTVSRAHQMMTAFEEDVRSGERAIPDYGQGVTVVIPESTESGARGGAAGGRQVTRESRAKSILTNIGKVLALSADDANGTPLDKDLSTVLATLQVACATARGDITTLLTLWAADDADAAGSTEDEDDDESDD